MMLVMLAGPAVIFVIIRRSVSVPWHRIRRIRPIAKLGDGVRPRRRTQHIAGGWQYQLTSLAARITRGKPTSRRREPRLVVRKPVRRRWRLQHVPTAAPCDRSSGLSRNELENVLELRLAAAATRSGLSPRCSTWGAWPSDPFGGGRALGRHLKQARGWRRGRGLKRGDLRGIGNRPLLPSVTPGMERHVWSHPTKKAPTFPRVGADGFILVRRRKRPCDACPHGTRDVRRQSTKEPVGPRGYGVKSKEPGTLAGKAWVKEASSIWKARPPRGYHFAWRQKLQGTDEATQRGREARHQPCARRGQQQAPCPQNMSSIAGI